MANIFKSKYTGEQIEEILDKANNVTDVQANNGEPTTADLSTLKIGNVNYKIPEAVEGVNVVANPSASGTEDLTKLQVGNIVYKIPEASEGVNVVANPSASGTENLTKLQVGNVVYNILSGGGGYRVYINFALPSSNPTAYCLTTDGIQIITSGINIVNNVLMVVVSEYSKITFEDDVFIVLSSGSNRVYIPTSNDAHISAELI